MGEPSYFDGIDQLDEMLEVINKQERRMKIYIAASFPRQDEALALGYKLMKHGGHEITSGWIEQQDPNANPNSDTRTPSPVERRNKAMRDLGDIRDSDVLVMITGDNLSGGGRRFEFGYAYGLGMPVIIYGEEEIIFDSLNVITVIDKGNASYGWLDEALKKVQADMDKKAEDQEPL